MVTVEVLEHVVLSYQTKSLFGGSVGPVLALGYC